MPIPILAEGLFNSESSIPYALPLVKAAAWIGAIYLLKLYFGGATNTSERLMHSKVIMITVGVAIFSSFHMLEF